MMKHRLPATNCALQPYGGRLAAVSLTVLGLAAAGLLSGVGGNAHGAPGRMAYRCRIGQLPQRVDPPPQTLTAEALANLQQWDLFAVSSIARAVKGEARLKDVLPLFETLLRAGPFAGSFADPNFAADPFLLARGRRLLDAASRLAHGTPIETVRALLSDQGLVAALRQDASGAARHGADYLVAKYQPAHQTRHGLALLLPALMCTRDHLSDPELVARAMARLDRGSFEDEVAELLAQTVLWDLRLYLLQKPSAEQVRAALARSDEDLLSDYTQVVAAAHLRYFLFGGREDAAAAKLWEALEADRFVAERPNFAWVGQAAALARELQRGTVLEVRGEMAPLLPQGGETLPLSYTVRPAEGASFATTYLVWPRSVAKQYDGVRCLEDTRSVLCPAPFGAPPSPSGLDYVLAFSKPGQHLLAFQYKLYGLELPQITCPIMVREPGVPGPQSPPAEPAAGWSPTPVVIELKRHPHGYQPVYNSGEPLQPGQRPVINGGRKVLEFADGQHAMEQLIIYEVRASDLDNFPAEVTYCDPNPRGNQAVAAQALEEAERLVATPLRAYFDLVPARVRVIGRECWVGRKGRGPDNKTYYVLCRGSQTYLVRSPMYLFQTFWDPIIGQNDVYDSARMKDDVVAYAQAVLAELGAAPGEAEATSSAAQGAPPTEAVAYLKQLRELLEQDADLVARLNLVAAGWQQKTLDDAAAAQTVATDIVPAYDVLAARAAGLQPPSDTLVGVTDEVRTALSLGMAASRLVEKGVRNADADKVSRGLGLLHGYDEQREKLKVQIMTLGLNYAEQMGGEGAGPP